MMSSISSSLYGSMADRFFDSDERRATIACNPTRILRSEMTDADFSSMYTCKSETPLMSRLRGVDDMGSVVAFTPSSACRVQQSVIWESPSNDVTCFADEETTFCNRFNAQNCLAYLNQEMMSFGLLPLFLGDTNKVDIVSFINNTYRLLKKQHANEKAQGELNERIQRLEHDLSVSSDSNDRLKSELDESDRSAARLELTVSQLRLANRDLAGKLKTEKDEVRKLESMMSHRHIQYLHEARKKEQELTKLKERMHKLITDKSVKKPGSGLSMSDALGRSSYVVDNADIYRTVVGSLEDRLVFSRNENTHLRRGLLDLQHELVTMLRSDNEKTSESDATAANYNELDATENDALLTATESASAPSTNAPADVLSEGNFEMPFDVTGEAMLASLKEKCRLLKERISNIEKTRHERELMSSTESVEESDVESATRAETEREQIEMLRNKLREYEFVIQEQQQLLVQTLDAPNDASDVSFLVETDHFEDSGANALKENFYRQQKAQLDEQRQKLMDYAAQLAKERGELEQLRLEVLHKEFMLLTPFRTNKGQNQMDGNASVVSLTDAETRSLPTIATPRTGTGFLSGMPTTSDLFRQLGIFATAGKRRNSFDGFMIATKSAIRNGLTIAGERRQSRSEEIMSNIDEVDNDNELAGDAVKVLEFDQHDEID